MRFRISPCHTLPTIWTSLKRSFSGFVRHIGFVGSQVPRRYDWTGPSKPLTSQCTHRRTSEGGSGFLATAGRTTPGRTIPSVGYARSTASCRSPPPRPGVDRVSSSPLFVSPDSSDSTDRPTARPRLLRVRRSCRERRHRRRVRRPFRPPTPRGTG